MFDPTESFIKIGIEQLEKFNRDIIRHHIQTRARYLPEDRRTDDIEAWTAELEHIESILGTWAFALEIHWSVRALQARQAGVIYNQAADADKILRNITTLIAILCGITLLAIKYSSFWVAPFGISATLFATLNMVTSAPTKMEIKLFLWRDGIIFPGTTITPRISCCAVVFSMLSSAWMFVYALVSLIKIHTPAAIFLAALSLAMNIALTYWLHGLKNEYAEQTGGIKSRI